MKTRKKVSPWRVRVPTIPKDILKAFPSFKNPSTAKPQGLAFLSAITDDTSAPTRDLVDWRSTGAVPAPRSQGSCNTCTSFAAVCAVESLHFLKYKARIRLAPGFIHSCLLNRPCDEGASPKEVLNAVAAHGISYGFPNDYPFPTDHCSTGNLYPVSRLALLAGPNASMVAMANQGPIVGDMFIDPAFFEVGPETIYRFNDSAEPRLHSIAIVGYDRPRGFWIVANSFGTGWGDRGFGRVAFGSGGLLDERRGWQILL